MKVRGTDEKGKKLERGNRRKATGETTQDNKRDKGGREERRLGAKEDKEKGGEINEGKNRRKR